MGGVTSAAPHLSEFEVSIRLRQTAGREQRRCGSSCHKGNAPFSGVKAKTG